jgi:nicotinamide mononucleotide adenylyltransferase
MSRIKKLTSIILISLGLSASLLIGCKATGSSSSDSSSSTSSQASSSTSFIDYTHNGSVKLQLAYSGKTFLKDGVEQVSLKTSIDGDTAHFTNAAGGTVKARFFGIDTPESTGKVQEYGKQASNYTKEKLTAANKNGTIVISSPQESYAAPEPDSTGTRYVSLVWINETKKNAGLDELYLLNLEIVQDGLSWVKNVLDMPEYSKVFYAAESQAEAFKLKLHSGEADPMFNYGDYDDVSLLDIKKEVIANMTDSTHENSFNGANVRVQGTVAGFSNHVIYIQNFYSKDEGATTEAGEYAGINIFVGMSAIPSKFTKKNAYIQVCGVAADSENFGFQISGASFQTVAYDENDAQVLIKPEDNTDEHALHTFEYTPDELSTCVNNKDYSALMSAVTLTKSVTVSRTYTSEDGEITLYFGSLDFSCYIAFSYLGDPDHTSYVWTGDDFKDQTFNVSGVFSFHKTTSGKFQFQINPSSTSDLVWVR